MAKRTRTTPDRSKRARTAAPTAATGDVSLEQRVVAFAEFAGRIAGTVQAKSTGWLDRNVLSAQLASLRDGADTLLQSLGTAAPGAETPPTRATPVKRATGRSGGKVDAPGKKRRAPLSSSAQSTAVKSQNARLRDALPMSKTPRHRGRG